MKKLIVKNVCVGTKLTFLNLADSQLGEIKPSKHPLRSYKLQRPNESIEGIKIGDILRCDGLPFMVNTCSIHNSTHHFERIGVKKDLFVLRKGATHKSNIRSSFKGVSWNKSSNKWIVRLGKGVNYVYLGLFTNEKEAYQAILNHKAKVSK